MVEVSFHGTVKYPLQNHKLYAVADPEILFRVVVKKFKLKKISFFFLISNQRNVINEDKEKYKKFMMMNNKKQKNQTTKQKIRNLER